MDVRRQEPSGAVRRQLTSGANVRRRVAPELGLVFEEDGAAVDSESTARGGGLVQTQRGLNHGEDASAHQHRAAAGSGASGRGDSAELRWCVVRMDDGQCVAVYWIEPGTSQFTAWVRPGIAGGGGIAGAVPETVVLLVFAKFW